MIPNLTTGQWLSILIGVLSATSGASAQLNDVFGATQAHAIVSIAGLIMTVIVTPVMFVVTGQSSVVKQVQAMPGVESILVNAKSNPTLAKIAVDPAQEKVEAIPAAAATVAQTAKGA